ncbi:MAG: carbohydrate binding domain-containing protein [Bacteroidales bacterium]|nr:carbohydrate binding domain-containing protein [Bacteroidales bacterium]
MKRSSVSRWLLLLMVALPALSMTAQPVEWTVNTRKTIADVNPDMYGIFFEDINFGADGGLYAELVKNRSFEFPQSLMGWKSFGRVEVLTQDAPFERNPHYVRLQSSGHPHKHTGLENEGFCGIGFHQDSLYRFSVWARTQGNEAQRIRVEFIDESNAVMARKSMKIQGENWKKYSMEMKATRMVNKGKLRIFYENRNTQAIDLEHISLFPKATWNNHENGLRRDLVQALADLKPGVLSFPGGCIVEGTDLATRYQWKHSVGAVENRPLNENRWQYTFAHRLFPDYYQSYGLGFYEYFLLAEEIGATALPVLSCGLACQYQNNDMSAHASMEDLQPFVQDALDLIEFANGAIDTQWGALRAEMGHPAPFNMKYLAIGNEQWGAEYPERLQVFVKAIRAQYPDIQIIGSSGPSADGEKFDYLWPEMKRLQVDLVDEHYYKSPEWFLANAARYDNYDRKGPKVFAGEYAAHDAPSAKANNFKSALAEACFMTGLERNADVVRLATYAPLFAHVEAWQWNPDLIWFDNLRSVKSINWYVQQLYSQYKGTQVCQTYSSDKQALSGQDGLYASAVIDKEKHQLILKLANANEQPKDWSIALKSLKEYHPQAKLIRLESSNELLENTLDAPYTVVPKEEMLLIDALPLQLSMPAKSFWVIVLDLTK